MTISAFLLDNQAMLIAMPMGGRQTIPFVTQTVNDQIASDLGQHATSEL